MNNKETEALTILQEEAAEVIQIASKCIRFGFDSVHPVTGESNRSRMEEELGDLSALQEYLVNRGVLDQSKLDLAKAAKITKLTKWSTLFKDES